MHIFEKKNYTEIIQNSVFISECIKSREEFQGIISDLERNEGGKYIFN